MKNIQIINGPNINMLGIRETNIYGNETWSKIETSILQEAKEVQASLDIFQSNHEGEIVDFIQKNSSKADGIIINPAGLSKTGFSLLDALLIYNIPYIEVHLSNIYSRGGWHSETIFSENAVGVISGFKGYVYNLALRAIIKHIK